MGLAAGVAFVSAAEVAAITQEPALASLDQGADATVVNLLTQASTALVFELQLRGITDGSVIQDLTLLKIPAAWWCAWRKFAGMPVGGEQGPVNIAKSKQYKDLFDRDIARVVLSIQQTGSATTELNSPLGLPCSGNMDAKPYNEPVDNRFPGVGPRPYYKTRP